MKYSKSYKETLKQTKRYYENIVILHIDSAAPMTARCKFTLRIHLENSEDLVIHYFTKDLPYVKDYAEMNSKCFQNDA